MIVSVALAILVSPWYWTVVAAVQGFWVTLLPAIPMQIGFIAVYKLIIDAIKKIFSRRKDKRNDKI